MKQHLTPERFMTHQHSQMWAEALRELVSSPSVLFNNQLNYNSIMSLIGVSRDSVR